MDSPTARPAEDELSVVLARGKAMRRILVAVALAAIGLAPMPAKAQTAHTCFGEPGTLVGTAGNDVSLTVAPPRSLGD
jgi:hypothetical protein